MMKKIYDVWIEQLFNIYKKPNLFSSGTKLAISDCEAKGGK